MLWRSQKWIHWVFGSIHFSFSLLLLVKWSFQSFLFRICFFFLILWWMKKKAWINKWNAIKFRGQKKNLSNSKPTWLSLQSIKILLFFSFYVHIKFKRKHNSTFISLFDKNKEKKILTIQILLFDILWVFLCLICYFLFFFSFFGTWAMFISRS